LDNSLITSWDSPKKEKTDYSAIALTASASNYEGLAVTEDYNKDKTEEGETN